MSSFHSYILQVLATSLISLALNHGATAADRTGYYGHGKPATIEEISGWDIDVRPDGLGLPNGRGSVEDGELLYEEKCSECHGSFGEGVGRFPVLAGGEGSLTDLRPSKTVGSYWPHLSTLWDYIHRTMPFTQPESLEDDEVYALTAYVLYLNDLVEDDFELTRDNFTSIEMPNKRSFIPEQRPDVHNTRCMENCKNADEIVVVSSIMPAVEIAEQEVLVDAITPASTGDLVYNQYCAICHRSGMSGAPVVGNETDWKARVAGGMLTLKQHAVKGYTGENGYMPPKGGFANLSDDEIHEAVDFMVESNR
jgi:S-disulfanyl-L-cysteine oxidoreductase SoxD